MALNAVDVFLNLYFRVLVEEPDYHKFKDYVVDGCIALPPRHSLKVLWRERDVIGIGGRRLCVLAFFRGEQIAAGGR